MKYFWVGDLLYGIQIDSCKNHYKSLVDTAEAFSFAIQFAMMKTTIYTLSFALISIIFLTECSNQKEDKVGPPLKLPPSSVSFNVHFPAAELSAGVNALLTPVLIDDEITINEKGDILYLKVIKTGNLDLSFESNTAKASMPLNVSLAIKKKMMGITFTNRDKPITFSGQIKTTSTATLDAAWNLTMECHDLDLTWESEPRLSIMGLEIDLGDTMTKVLDENEEKILNEICNAINRSLDIRKTMEKLWGDIQTPMRVTQKPQPFWLHTRPEALNAVLLPLNNDTLSIHLAYKSELAIRPTSTRRQPIIPLPAKGIPLNESSAILAYIDTRIPLTLLDQLISNKISGQSFSYQDYSIKIEGASVAQAGSKMAIKLNVRGDLDGVVTIKGRPFLTRKQVLRWKDFEYEIDSRDPIAKTAHWFLKSMIEGYITDEISVDVSSYLLNIDSLAEQGLTKAPIGKKLKAELNFNSVNEHQQRIDADTLQWILYVEGRANLILNRHILAKKK